MYRNSSYLKKDGALRSESKKSSSSLALENEKRKASPENATDLKGDAWCGDLLGVKSIKYQLSSDVAVFEPNFSPRGNAGLIPSIPRKGKHS